MKVMSNQRTASKVWHEDINFLPPLYLPPTPPLRGREGAKGGKWRYENVLTYNNESYIRLKGYILGILQGYLFFATTPLTSLTGGKNGECDNFFNLFSTMTYTYTSFYHQWSIQGCWYLVHVCIWGILFIA